MSKRPLKLKIPLLVGSISLLVVMLYRQQSASHGAVPHPAEPTLGTMQLTNAGQSPPSVGTPPSTTTASPSAPLAATSPRAQIDAFLKAGSPSDKFAAYKLIRACVDARQDELLVAERVAGGGKPMPKTSAQVCGDISPGQVAMKKQLVLEAAKAGVHGAPSKLLDEGPRGDGQPRSTDENDAESIAFDQQVEQAIEAGAKSGDWWSLSMRSQEERGKPGNVADYGKAMNDLEAANAAYRAEFGKDMNSYANLKGRITYLSNRQKIGQANE